MARAIAEIEDEIRRLPAKAQERLLHVLLEELDGPPDPDVEAAHRSAPAHRCGAIRRRGR